MTRETTIEPDSTGGAPRTAERSTRRPAPAGRGRTHLGAAPGARLGVPVVRILVADDHEVVRRGVRALLEAQSGWVVCGEAVSGREAVDKTLQLAPDVAIIDIGMPELNGLEATRQLRKERPDTEVLILTMH